ncbi:MAG: sterol desaturase family protein [Bdellovibrionota bacterium]
MLNATKLLSYGKNQPWSPYAVFTPVALILICSGLASPLQFHEALLSIGFGFASHSLAEYLIHRLSFHRRRDALGAVSEMIVDRHIDHHARPNHRETVVAPPLMVLAFFLVVITVVRALSGSAGFTAYAGFGMVAGHLNYEWRHYLAHFGLPVNPRARELKRHHLLHHFADDTAGFGVSTRFWDRVFGTLAPSKRTEPASDPTLQL